jgi:hypothetical protein
MTALALFCLVTALFLAARDVFVPEVGDVEVWLGFEVHGAAARWSAGVHWAVFLAGAIAFWRARPWILPAAAAYAFYVALSHLIWSGTSPRGHGWPAGLAYALLFSIPGALLLLAHQTWRARPAQPPY